MNKKILILLGAIFVVCGCYKDKTKFGDKDISEIKYISGISTKYAYEIDKWDTITIKPEISQSIEKELKYEWEVDYKIVSKEPVLNYVCDTLGEFKCRYKVYNEDGATTVTFDLNVNSPYQSGLVVLSNIDNKGMASFKRTDLNLEDIVKRKSIVDCIKLENPNVEIGEFGGVAVSGEYLFFATKNPDKFLRVTSNTFKATNYIEPKFTNLSMLCSSSSSILMTYDGDKVIEYLTGKDNAFFGNINSAIAKLKLPNVKIDPICAYLYPEGSNYKSWTLVFDYTNEQLIKHGKSTTIVSKDTFKGLKPIAFVPCYNRENCVLIFKDNEGKSKLFHFVSSIDVIDNTVDFGTNNTLNDGSVAVAPNSIETNIIYSDGANKIYRFNYIAANLPTTPFIEMPDGLVIKSLIMAAKNELLYVLVKDTKSTSKYKSAIYCYHYQTKTLLWSENEVGGDPVGMVFK